MFPISLIDLTRRCFSICDGADEGFLSVQLLMSEETDERVPGISDGPLAIKASLSSAGLLPLADADVLSRRSCLILRPNALLRDACEEQNDDGWYDSGSK